MEWKKEYKPLLWIVGIFIAFFFLPIESIRLQGAVIEAFELAKWYAREHVLLCLVPAFFIAGAITVFVSESSVMKYLGPAANKVLAYGVASVSGTILAVCSCTILPLLCLLLSFSLKWCVLSALNLACEDIFDRLFSLQ